MPFLHSLVKLKIAGTNGWLAPVEIGETAPHYVNFALPLDHSQNFHREYACEVMEAGEGEKKTIPQKLVRQGEDSFVLSAARQKLWFAVRPVPKTEQRLPYIGKLRHPDFAGLFVEIEPQDPAKLDRLFDDEGIFIIGCDPFAHYKGITLAAKKHHVKG